MLASHDAAACSTPHGPSARLPGASALDKRAFKSWRATMLQRIGAAADKKPRTPAKIGIGMAKAAKEREKKALEEAMAAGMVQRKGRGKKLRAEAGEAAWRAGLQGRARAASAGVLACGGSDCG
jgi:hypothetical protein